MGTVVRHVLSPKDGARHLNSQHEIRRMGVRMVSAIPKASGLCLQILCVAALSGPSWLSTPAAADEENKQAMAQTPAELLEMLADVSFLKPDAYEARILQLMGDHARRLGVEAQPQLLDEATDPRRTISAKEIATYVEALTEFALESKRDGNVLWGRIQGTKYERNTLAWVARQLESIGIDDVQYDRFPTQYSQWRPTVSSLVVTAAPGFSEGESFTFEHAVTAFVSATTPPGGIERKMIYVGDGTAAELAGRDLSDKIVLLRGRTLPSAMLSSVRTAFSRLASGRYGKPAGVVVWWDVPRTTQVAGRVGAPGGGDAIGEALPWTSIGDDAGLYLRKLLDRARKDAPVEVRLEVRGEMRSGDMTGNVYATLPGQSGKKIVIPTHVDGYFYGIHDNGGAVAINLALARYFSSLPPEQRHHDLVFFFQGDHEVPGVGGTLPWVRENVEMLERDLLMVLRPEHIGMVRPLDEGAFIGTSNVTEPLMLTLTNQSPLIAEIFLRAAQLYSLSIGDVLVIEPAADEAAFHPPFHDIGAISAGWVQSTKFYHSSADVDWARRGWGGVSLDQLEKFARAHAYIVERLFEHTKADLTRDGQPLPEVPIYQSDLLKLFLGNN